MEINSRFGWNAQQEQLAHDFLTGALWKKTDKPLKRRAGGPPLTAADKSRIGGMIGILDRYVRDDFRQQHASKRSKRVGGTCGQVIVPSPNQPGGFTTQVLCDDQPTMMQQPTFGVPYQQPIQQPSLGFQQPPFGFPPTAPPFAPTTSNFLAPTPGFGSYLPAIGTGVLATSGAAAGLYGASQLAQGIGNLVAAPPPDPSLLTRLGARVSSWFQNFQNPFTPAPPPPDPGLLQRALGAIKGVGSAIAEKGLGFVTGTYQLLKSAITTGWGYFQPVIASVAGFLTSIPGWAFLLVPLTAAAVYLYYHRFAQRPESAPERKSGALRLKVQAMGSYIVQLGQSLLGPEFQSMTDMLQAALPALNRYLNQLNLFDNILAVTPPESEPANSPEMLAELLTIQTNVETLVQKIRQMVSPQSVAIAQANQQTSFPSSTGFGFQSPTPFRQASYNPGSFY